MGLTIKNLKVNSFSLMIIDFLRVMHFALHLCTVLNAKALFNYGKDNRALNCHNLFVLCFFAFCVGIEVEVTVCRSSATWNKRLGE